MSRQKLKRKNCVKITGGGGEGIVSLRENELCQKIILVCLTILLHFASSSKKVFCETKKLPEDYFSLRR